MDIEQRSIPLFQSQASTPKHALVMIYDLEGFSKFFNQPDVQDYVPTFINAVSESISIIIDGNEHYWLPEDTKSKKRAPLEKPAHTKYLGDGGLFIWLSQNGQKDFSQVFIGNLSNSLWNLKTNFHQVIKRTLDTIPVFDVPKKIRFGIARGTVYELTTYIGGQKEYVGFCINLASRLQKYCPDLGFIASARVGLPDELLAKYGYMKVVATQLKGFPKEIVVVDKSEYSRLLPEIQQTLFEEIK